MDPETEIFPSRTPETASPEGHTPPDEEQCLAPEVLPNLDALVIEDDTPLDSIFAEKQQRLLTEPLYSSWPGPGEGRPFLALANVGLFHEDKQTSLVPDAMLSLDVKLGEDLSRKENRSYYTWILGKSPDVVIEVVSDRTGGEDSYKLRQYARIRVAYYVIFDPQEHLGQGVLRAYQLTGTEYRPASPEWFADVGLGLTRWEGSYEGLKWCWLRWCDRDGRVIPTASELIEQERQRAEQERQRAEQERQRRERLEAKLRAMGIDPATLEGNEETPS